MLFIKNELNKEIDVVDEITATINNYTISRFFNYLDVKNKNFVFNLAPTWWSRFYEYAWCENFVNDKDIVLDAACGICHPLKFYLSDNCKEVYACDIDDRIKDKKAILKDITETYSGNPLDLVKEKWFKDINFDLASLTQLPYTDKMFDKIFCVSVLEHLVDENNMCFKNSSFKIDFTKTHQILDSLMEFKRVLKADGLIILTFDYPTITLKYLETIVRSLELEFIDEVDFNLPQDAIYSKLYNLYCFRAVLRKKISREALG